VKASNAGGDSPWSLVWRFTTGTTYNKSTDITGSENKPGSYHLDQNYPNPFNPSTRISFALPENGYVILKIYNSLGQEITTLINKELTAGMHNIEWNAANLPSGIYYYRIQSGNFTDMKKMLYIR
jgi:hypothetical protein